MKQKEKYIGVAQIQICSVGCLESIFVWGFLFLFDIGGHLKCALKGVGKLGKRYLYLITYLPIYHPF